MVIDHRGIGALVNQNIDRKSRLVTDRAALSAQPTVRSTKALTTPNTNGRATTCTRIRWKASLACSSAALIGIYQHVDAKHFDRYLAEFDFRMNTRAKLGINDVQRDGNCRQRRNGQAADVSNN